MAKDLRVKIYVVWWWRGLYWPLTRAGLWLGLPFDVDRIYADLRKAVRVVHIP